ncbi:MAG TPA: hypothetical protein VHM48_05010, partial [Candidatus Limnocylindrales bacterium]|nr:hypothetical protein [Candidatus Limnocylindrales bacterium]
CLVGRSLVGRSRSLVGRSLVGRSRSLVGRSLVGVCRDGRKVPGRGRGHLRCLGPDRYGSDLRPVGDPGLAFCHVAARLYLRSLVRHQRTIGLAAMATTMPTATTMATMIIRIRA